MCYLNVHKNALSNLMGRDEASHTNKRPHGCGEVLTQRRVCSGYGLKKIQDYRTSRATITAVPVDTNHERGHEQPRGTANTGGSTGKMSRNCFVYEHDCTRARGQSRSISVSISYC